MGLAHQSIATIDAPEFINLSPLDINPLMSKCDIKVFYLGKNRNGSFISKVVAEEMAKTLRGAPIVGYFKQENQDFRDHGKQLVLDGDGIHFNCLTKPYGFVSPEAEVWFKDFEELDQSGEKVVRTYLMTNGYLWTGQFEEISKLYKDNGKPQSMQLDEKTLKGQWTKQENSEVEFFIINDAIFSKLCILGDDVQPCFQGAGVTPPNASFTLDDHFKQTLFEMMQELTQVLKGGSQVADVKDEVVQSLETESTQFALDDKDNFGQSSFDEKQNNQIQQVSTSFADDDDDDDQNDETSSNDEEEDSSKDDDEQKKKYSLLENQYNELKSNYDNLEKEVVSLREFKVKVEDKQKEELINQFYMLSDEDKKEVIENKSKYSLDEIKAKLAVICFEKKVNFNLQSSSETEENKKEVVTTFNIEDTKDLSVPDWVKEVEHTMNNKY